MIRVATKFGTVLMAVALLTACSSTKEEASAPVAQAPTSSIVPGSAEDFRVNVGDTVFFDLDQHSVRADAQSVLQKQAAWLKQYPQVKLLVEGHCDERGTREYNLALGDRRA
ncbi:MAG: OmpA family protein, partial [Alphaproteobacteria bacterium]|nr:OmpA family protein [Alphaproteobacteria bacterium]